MILSRSEINSVECRKKSDGIWRSAKRRGKNREGRKNVGPSVFAAGAVAVIFEPDC